MKILSLVIATLLLPLSSPSWAGQSYATSGDCGGFPKVDLATAPGACVGLIAAHLGYPRGIAVLGDAVYVVDMGGWRLGHGRLLRLGDHSRQKAEVLLSGLDEPNALLAEKDGTLLIGLAGRIVRFDPKSRVLQDVVTGLPTSGRHPLPALAETADGTLYINVGSASDNCENEAGDKPNPAQPCPETLENPPRGSVLRLPADAPRPASAASLPVVARGLRNSMALTLLADGKLVAAVNARDFIDHADPALPDEDLPHDTLVSVEEADYGWPYCYDFGIASPEYPGFDCSKKRRPDLLLPAHAAPLGMVRRDNHLLIAYHGYRATGHRIVSLTLDGASQDLIWDWDFSPGHHPQGAPVGLAVLPDGSLLISEDHNGTLLRLVQ